MHLVNFPRLSSTTRQVAPTWGVRCPYIHELNENKCESLCAPNLIPLRATGSTLVPE